MKHNTVFPAEFSFVKELGSNFRNYSQHKINIFSEDLAEVGGVCC